MRRFCSAIVALALSLALASCYPMPPDTPASDSVAPSEAASSAPAVESLSREELVEWAQATYPQFEIEQYAGTTEQVLELPAPVGLLTASVVPNASLRIDLLDDSGETVDTLLSVNHSYQGTFVWPNRFSREGTSVRVVSEAPWSVTFAPVSTAPDAVAAGSGDAVMFYGGADAQAALHYEGDGPFIVAQHVQPTGTGMTFLTSRSGSFDGEVAFRQGPSLISVRSDGDWSIDFTSR